MPQAIHADQYVTTSASSMAEEQPPRWHNIGFITGSQENTTTTRTRRDFIDQTPYLDVRIDNLSFSVDEEQLMTLFSQYINVQSISIARGSPIIPSMYNFTQAPMINDDCPLYAIVTVSNTAEAQEMKELFHRHLFMGRPLSISAPSTNNHGKIVYAVTFKTIGALTRPLESMLRRLLVSHSIISDVNIVGFQQDNDYQWNIDTINSCTHGSGFALITIPSGLLEVGIDVLQGLFESASGESLAIIHCEVVYTNPSQQQ